ncbi:MAG: hypothetical protein WDN28_25495 [Chthoniobacter sp.]
MLIRFFPFPELPAGRRRHEILQRLGVCASPIGQWTDHQAFYGLPGYAYCLALIFLLVGGFDPFVVGILQALFDAGIAVTVMADFARSIFRLRSQ